MHIATSHIVIFVFTLIRYIQSCISSLCIFQVKSHPCLSARCQILYISTISAAGDLLYISIDLSFNFNLVLYFTCIFFFKFSFHFGARDYTLCYKFMFGYLCLCTRSNNRNWIKNDEKTPFCVTILGRCFNGMSFPGC